MRLDPGAGVIEVGDIRLFTGACSTHRGHRIDVPDDARAFEELGYRRYEWKCDALNAPPVRREPPRLHFEGIFRQAAIYKGRNRDTAWFAITDRDWPALKPPLRTGSPRPTLIARANKGNASET